MYRLPLTIGKKSSLIFARKCGSTPLALFRARISPHLDCACCCGISRENDRARVRIGRHQPSGSESKFAGFARRQVCSACARSAARRVECATVMGSRGRRFWRWPPSATDHASARRWHGSSGRVACGQPSVGTQSGTDTETGCVHVTDASGPRNSDLIQVMASATGAAPPAMRDQLQAMILVMQRTIKS